VPEQASDRNNLQIDFLSISTGGSDASTRYQYRLEGVDADWSKPTTERSVTLANLSPGTYLFQVRALNAAGSFSPEPAEVAFIVLRPLWQQWWFLLAAAAAVGLAIYALYHYRVRQLLHLEQVRTRIATDLHDDIGASLSQIAILSEVVQQRISSENGAAQAAGEPLKVIAGTSREIVDAMSDIVWAINPQKDHLSDLVHRMRRFASDTLESCDIGYGFRAPEHLRDIALGADFRREIYLIFKECINNLVKHSRASRALIDLRLESNFLIVEVEDDGVGFDAAAEMASGGRDRLGGNGLMNMRRRAENLGGSFHIESEKGRGTRATLRLPVKGKGWKRSSAAVRRG
jgi:two-component sensor histidine kinase